MTSVLSGQFILHAFLKPRKNISSMHTVMALLALLVALFFSGMLLLSHLNLSYSQKAMAELRRDQIRDVFLTSLTRIHGRQMALQRHTVTLSRLGEAFHRLSLDGKSGIPAREELRAQLDLALRTHLSDFEGAAGAGIWFEPGVLAPPGEHYSPYVIDSKNQPVPRPVDTTTIREGYRSQLWFERALGKNWRVEEHQEDQVYWSPVYFDVANDRAVLTLASPLFSAQGKLIGIATTDWTSSQIIDLVSRVEVTENSFSFLNDRNNRNLSSLSRSNNVRLEQNIIDAILDQRLSGGKEPDPLPNSAPERLQQRVLEVDDRIYELYYARTPAGMVYGAVVPRDEVDRVLVPMQATNHRILLSTGLGLLILSLYLLYRIVQLIRELQASYRDALTRLPNRARLLKDLEDRREASLIVINLDRFKEINSLFGNACGDHVLLTVAEQLLRFTSVRSSTLSARVYRLAGDEFALLSSLTAEPRIREFTEDLGHFLRSNRVHWEQQSLSLDASAGIAFRQGERRVAAPDQLLTQATIALRLAREQMRNYLIYDPQQEIEKDYEQNLFWAQRLKNALEQDQIIPHFQPIYDNQLGRISKYECLARMVDPDQGIVTAGRFLGIAQRLRLNRQITRVMIEKSFAQFLHEPYEFSINLSYSDLVEPEILALILKHLRSSAIGSRIIFEILESDGIENYSEVLHFIGQVKPFGCQIAIDDFGTGYSNFAHVLQLNVDIIKIDGSLIRYLDTDETAFLVTKGIVQFARSLGIRTVAEFVHNAAIQARVVKLGIDFSQGACFSMPGPAIARQYLPSMEH